MKLTFDALPSLKGADKPPAALFRLPEKVLQFGTGVLLRALPDDIIDRANREGRFDGRIVVIKSTSSGSTDAFDLQQNLYTVCVRGLLNGKEVVENRINGSISRVMDANREWRKIIELAGSADLQYVVSNTTEAGLVAFDDSITDAPPASFPGKLLAFLYQRYQVFGAAPAAGMTILPTELVTDNGIVLRQLLTEKARLQELGNGFIDWLETHNRFCNTLVDRIVPGAYRAPELDYDDELMIMAEPYYLWAIETDKADIPFAVDDPGVILAPSIYRYRELKLRLLNAAHSFSCALALQAGFETVKAAMSDAAFAGFFQQLLQEIGFAITGDSLQPEAVTAFAESVTDRFRNPFLEHRWTSIAQHYPDKFRLRCISIIERWYTKSNELPAAMASGTAAFLLYDHRNNPVSVRAYEGWPALSVLPGWEEGVLSCMEKLQQQPIMTIFKTLNQPTN